MTALTIILASLAVVANATMDEIRFHWDRWFGKVIKKDQWANPSKSWTNKYVKSPFFTWLLSGPLVMFTDFWHLLKFIVINSVFGIVLDIAQLSWSAWEYVVAILLLNIVWGIVYETVLGIYGALSDKYIK